MDQSINPEHGSLMERVLYEVKKGDRRSGSSFGTV